QVHQLTLADPDRWHVGRGVAAESVGEVVGAVVEGGATAQTDLAGDVEGGGIGDRVRSSYAIGGQVETGKRVELDRGGRGAVADRHRADRLGREGVAGAVLDQARKLHLTTGGHGEDEVRPLSHPVWDRLRPDL